MKIRRKVKNKEVFERINFKMNLEEITNLVKSADEELANKKINFYLNGDLDKVLIVCQGAFIKYAKEGSIEYLQYKQAFKAFAENLRAYEYKGKSSLAKSLFEEKHENVEQSIKYCEIARINHEKNNNLGQGM